MFSYWVSKRGVRWTNPNSPGIQDRPIGRHPGRVHDILGFWLGDFYFNKQCRLLARGFKRFTERHPGFWLRMAGLSSRPATAWNRLKIHFDLSTKKPPACRGLYEQLQMNQYKR